MVPEVRELVPILIERVLSNGLHIMITSTARTVQCQAALYAQGRKSLLEVNALRKSVGLFPITQKENEHCVTWTMHSRHLINLLDADPANDHCDAFDFVIMNSSTPVWSVKVDLNNNFRPDYFEVGRVIEDLGLEWGGNWTNPDYPHAQRRR